MFGFRASVKGICRIASPFQINSVNSLKRLSLNWSLKQSTNMMMRCMPVLGSAINIINLREMLQKCKKQSTTSIKFVSESIIF